MTLEIKNLSFSYDGKNPVLENCGLKLERGECAAVAGKNGSGKSTLIKIISGVIPGLEAGNLSGEVSLSAGRSPSVVFQDLDSQFICDSGSEEFAFFSRYCAKNSPYSQGEISSLLNIEGLLSKNTSVLSAGQKQKLLIAMAICFSGGELLLLDEPGAYLDEASKKETVRALKALKERGISILMAGHCFPWLRGVVDSFYVIKSGRLEKSSAAPAEEKKFSLDSPRGEEILRAVDLEFAFQDESVLRYEGIFRLRGGGASVLTGENGSGKTTFCRILSGRAGNFGGRLLYRGKSVSRRDLRKKVFYIGSMPQNQLLFPKVGENLAFHAKRGRRSSGESAARVLEKYLGRHVGTLSYGEMQKVLLFCALVSSPEVIIMDEPLLSMDSENLGLAFKALSDFSKKGGSVLMTSHSREIMESFCRSVYEIREGRITGRTARYEKILS